MLISPVIPMMSLYRLPHGQYGYSGHIINLPQDVTTFAHSLPRHPSNLDVVVVRMAVAQSHKDFRIRKRKVLSALKWLIANNPYYRNIILDEDALQALPEDGYVSSHFTSAQYIPSDESMQDADVQMSEDAQTSRTLLPVGAGHHLTEEETVRQTIDKRAVPWPSRNSSSPVSEFTTEGYMSCAFPTLYLELLIFWHRGIFELHQETTSST